MLLFLLAVAQSDSQVTQIARTFGVDWQHLGAQIISFSIVCAVLHKFAYRRILAMLEQRREQIALGIANAEKIKAELDKTETQRQEVMAQAHTQGAKFVERSPGCSGPRAARGNQEGYCSCRTDHEEGARSRRSGPRSNACRTQTRGRQSSGPGHDNGHWQDSYRGRPATLSRRNFQTDCGLTMKISKKAKREAKRLYRFCLLNGLLDENRGRQVVQRVVAAGERDCLPILTHFLRLVKLDRAQHTATVESATPVTGRFTDDRKNRVGAPLRARVDYGVRTAHGVDWRDANSSGMRCL